MNNYEITFERDNFVSGSSDSINLADLNDDWAATNMFNGVADGPRVRINRAIPFYEWGGPEFKFNLKCKYQGGGPNPPVEQTYEVQARLSDDCITCYVINFSYVINYDVIEDNPKSFWWEKKMVILIEHQFLNRYRPTSSKSLKAYLSLVLKYIDDSYGICHTIH